jgi:hypothetical protein
MQTMRVSLSLLVLAGVGLASGFAAAPSRAHACGGLFCNRSQPVNQAAERILFVQNDTGSAAKNGGTGSVTAAIEIKYEGPSNSFSWVLPVSGVPKVAVSSTLAFDRLQQQTNPQYMLQTSFANGCSPLGTGSAGTSTSFRNASADHGSSVMVLAAGSVGPYDYEVISVKPELPDAADVAVQWLMANGYDVTDLGPGVLRPYLADGLNLLAFRLSKDSMTGSIRPVLITYDAKLPSIPIRPTAVAANDNMGVMVWVVSNTRAIPENYKALELNEALIDWFNPMGTYNAVVSAAADEAGGQGFVTELAQSSSTFKNLLVRDFEQQQWDRISNQKYATAADFVRDAQSTFAGWDGFLDALKDAAKLPANVSAMDLANCPTCYANDPAFAFDQSVFLKSLYEKVWKPMLDTQALLTSRPYVTRLYTTMSADEMTMDPAFDFNPDVGDVSNVHTATQVIACDQSWTVTLPQGDVVVGKQAGTWPNKLGKDQPAARKILQLATQGKGTVMLDNSAKISKLLLNAAAKQGVTVMPNADGGMPTVLQGGSKGGCVVSTVGAQSSGQALRSAALGLLLFALRARRRRAD